MAEYPELTKADLAEFTGRPEASFRDGEVKTALAQATLLFKIGTCLKVWPDDSVEADLARMGLLALADHVVLRLPHAAALASPFNSESLGSYSYSKTAAKVQVGDPTGVMWFDLAVSRLGVCDLNDDVVDFGGIEMMEHDAEFVAGSTGGNVRFLSEADKALHDHYVVLSRN